MSVKISLLSASAVALLFATGCREQPEQAQPVAQAQQQSEQALERAEEAQEQALDQREGLTDAREEVAEQRQELREAQQEVQQESQQALEAQREAQRQAELAQQQAQQAREQLAQRQQQLPEPGMGQAQPGAEQQPGAMLTISGQVVQAQEDLLQVRSQQGESVRLVLNEDTQVFINGQPGEVNAIQQGAQVRASYMPQEGDDAALRVDVMSPAGTGQPQQQ